MTSVIADTGFWLALLNDADKHHARARDLHESNDFAYVTTVPVLVEACQLLAARLGAGAAIELVEVGAKREFAIADAPDDFIERSASLMRKYKNLPMDLADASLVVLAETLGHGRILSTDRRDFTTYRWKNHAPFSNLMFPHD